MRVVCLGKYHEFLVDKLKQRLDGDCSFVDGNVVVSRLFVKKVLGLHGIPKNIQPSFINEMCKLNLIKWKNRKSITILKT